MKLQRSFVIGALVVMAALLLPFGSVEDRAFLAALWILSRVPTVRDYVKQIQSKLSIEDVRSLLLSVVAIVWAWGNARFRTGGGPFHMMAAGQWRGYPFMFEEWGWSDSYPTVTVWRELHWLGLAGNLLILAAACFWIVRRFPARRSHVFTLFLCVVSAVFVWLNVEPWVQGAPVTLVGPPGTSPIGQMSSFWSTLVQGFPWAYADAEHAGLRTWPLVGNVLVGCIALVLLFRLSKASSNADVSPSR